MSHEKFPSDETIMKMTIEELDLSIRAFNLLKRAGIDTVRDLYKFLDNGAEFCRRKLGKKYLSEITHKAMLLGYPVNEWYAAEELSTNDIRLFTEKFGVSKKAAQLLLRSGVHDIDTLVRVWEDKGLAELERMLKSAEDKYVTYIFSDAKPIIAEIVTKLALYGINVRDGLGKYIKELINEDAKYSVVRFWRSIRMVLTYLPNGSYSKLKADKYEQYANSYKYVVQCILEEQGKTPGEVLPAEDYIEVICSKCSHSQSYYFRDIFTVSCGLCEAKPAAEINGFDLYTKDECEENDISLDGLEENLMILDAVEDIDALFVCKLCRCICGAVNLTNYDYSELKELADSQVCLGCEGASFLIWIADKTNNSVLIDGEYVYLTDNESGKETSFYKDELSPKNLWKKIFSD